MRALRIIAFAFGGLLALLVLALIGVWLIVNPNDYKDRIIREVKASTGRELALPGAIRLSVFPWVALELGPASLGNPAGFQGGEFVSVEHAALRVRLLPLLHRRLQIGHIQIDQLNLNLQKNAAGTGNWENFGSHPASGAPASDSERAPAGSIFQSLAGVTLSNSRIVYDGLTISGLNVSIGGVSGEYHLADLSITGQLQSKPGASPLPFAFTMPAANLDLNQQTLQIGQFAGQYASAKLSGSLKGERVVDHPALTGSVELEPVALQALAAQLGISLPKTRDSQVLSRLSAKTDFDYADKAVHLRNLQAQLDDSHLQGSVAVTDLDTRAATFALNLDHIDIDRYRAPVQSAPTAQTSTPSAQLPSNALKSLDLHGSFAIGSAKFSGMTMSDLNLGLQARDGLIQLTPLTAKMYGGRYSGAITYDVRNAAPELQLNQQLTGIDMAPLLKDAINSQRLSGHGNATVTLAGHGSDSDAIMKSLNGKIDLNLAEGAVTGADLAYEIGVAQALLKRQAPTGAVNTRQTKFDALRMTATVTDGVAKTTDLLAATSYLRVSGQGTTSLVTKAIDLRLVATVLKEPPQAQGADLAQLTLAEIPVTVTGTADAPKVRPDLQGLVKSQLQQKAKDLIKDKLKGLFGTH
ncbi:MAG TPA: AsmA family protein [Steroidobacteraceae bacterium]|jgi:AsmA protein